MKKRILLFFAIYALLLGLCACSAKVSEPTWQEQFDLGVRYLSESNYEEAILAFTAAIEIDPKQTEAYEKLADAYLALGDTEAALQALKDGYAATGDAKLQAAIVEVIASEPSSTQEPPYELPSESTPVVAPISRSALYPMDYIGMTVDSLAELWGADYQTIEYLYAGGARPIYYEDGRISMIFFVLETFGENYGVHGDDEIILVRISEGIDEVASGIPTRATYPQLVNLGYDGQLTLMEEGEGTHGETAMFYMKYDPKISIYFSWYNYSDPKTTQAKMVEIWKSTEPTPTPTPVPTQNSDFVIENGVLVKYTGPGGDVTIPDGVTSIGDRAFANCSDLISVTIPDSVTNIGDGAFAVCIGLTSVTIPNSVKNIGVGAFYHCISLTSIDIPHSVTRISSSMFEDCCFTSITIPSSVTTIGDAAFYNCNRLTSIVIPNSVTKIEDSAFELCIKLKSIVISNSVTSIGHGVFSDSGIADIYYTGTEEQWAAIDIMGGMVHEWASVNIHYNFGG